VTEGPRAAKLNELPAVVQLVNDVFLAGLDVPPVLGDFFPQLYNENSLENLLVIFEDGKPISHLGMWEGELLMYGCLLKVGMIGCVCTHKDHRGRGYASALMRDAFSKMRKDGVDLVLVTGFRDLYRRMDCVEAGRVYIYRIQAGKMSLKDSKIKIIPYSEGNIYDLVKVYQKEPVRYLRTLGDFRLLVERGLHCKDIFLKTFIAVERGNPLAYISVGLVPDEKEIRIFEYAGSAEAVLHLTEDIFRTTRVKSLELTVPFQDWELLCLLERNGFKRPPSEAQVSTAIINPESFLKKIDPYLKERTGQQAPFEVARTPTGKLRLKFQKQEAEIDERAFTLLFFGTPQIVRDKNQPKTELEQTLGLCEILPLPTPTYGLNYV